MNKNIIYIGNKLVSHGYTPSNIDTLGQQLENEGFKVIYASSKKNYLLRFVDMLYTIFINRKTTGAVLIDTYSTMAFYYAYACGWLSLKLNIPYIPILHGGDLPDRIKKSPKITHFYFINSFVNIIISDYLKNAIEQFNFKYNIIYNNINIILYSYVNRNNIKPNILWVRSFHKIYNPTMAIHVLAKLKKKYPEAKLTMVGPDKDGTLNICQTLAEELKIKDAIQFTGKLNKEEWIKQSSNYDIFINTTDFDNLPVSVIEAQALGFPIISTNVGGIPYLITDKVDGILITANDTDKMVEEIINLLENPTYTAIISKNARLSAEKYDWSIIKEKWNELLSPLVQ